VSEGAVSALPGFVAALGDTLSPSDRVTLAAVFDSPLAPWLGLVSPQAMCHQAGGHIPGCVGRQPGTPDDALNPMAPFGLPAGPPHVCWRPRPGRLVAASRLTPQALARPSPLRSALRETRRCGASYCC
jgi:hypothetical protein